MIKEADIHGISTRHVDDVFKALGMERISKSQASRLCGEIDERVGAFPCSVGSEAIGRMSGWTQPMGKCASATASSPSR